MTKRDKKKQERRPCGFCGALGLTDEHFWPKWAAHLVPSSDYYTRRLVVGDEWRVEKFTKRQGSTRHIKLNTVCAPCNNEWMNRLEGEVRPWLEPMAKMEPIKLTPDAKLTLAQYFMMKVFVADLSQWDDPAFTSTQREAFKSNRSIPNGVLISVHRYVFEVSEEVAQYNKERPYKPPSIINPRYIPANFTFRFGPLFIQVLNFGTEADVKINQRPGSGVILFPHHDDAVDWPPAHTLSHFNAYGMQHFLGVVDKAFPRFLPRH